MALPSELVGVLQVLVKTGESKPGELRDIIDLMYTEFCISLLETCIEDYPKLSNKNIKELVDPLLQQTVEDFNEVLKDSNITLNNWTCDTLAKRVCAGVDIEKAKT